MGIPISTFINVMHEQLNEASAALARTSRGDRAVFGLMFEAVNSVFAFRESLREVAEREAFEDANAEISQPVFVSEEDMRQSLRVDVLNEFIERSASE